MSTTALTHLVLPLRKTLFDLLLRFITDPDKKHQSGGYQDRKEKWRTKINEPMRCIELDEDDIDWIKRQIINQHGGGWQSKIAVIFAGQHKEFSRLPIAPRKKPEDRRHRK
jgi:hypothetical protein